MNNQICPIHNVAFVHKTGVSKKTNEAYDFWSCPEKDNEGNFCKGGKMSPHEQIMNALRIMMAEIQNIQRDLAKRP